MKKRILVFAVMAFAASGLAGAQSRSFNIGKWMEIHSDILKTLSVSYVDTLPTDRMMRAAIDAMLEEIDPYTVYIPEEENEDFEMMIGKTYGGIGAIIHKKVGENVIINEPYAGSPAVRAGLECGDEILEIDGVDTKPFESRQASERMKGQAGTDVCFKVKKVRTGEIVNLKITRERIHLPDVEYAGMIDDTTGYILQSGFTSSVASEIKSSYYKLKEAGMKKLVLDLRGNGGGLMAEAIDIVSLFVPKGSLAVSSKGRMDSATKEYRTTSEPVDTKIPLVVLIDGGSASASEIVAGALQDLDRATIMGQRSYGKGLVQRVMPVAYNGQLKVTTAKYYTPSGRCVQAIDYSTRNEDGSIEHIPDSLTHEFKTASGRIVRDGGGITPDITLNPEKYSRIVYSLVLGGIVDNYVMKFVRSNATLPVPEEFYLTDSQWEDFVAFAKTQEFDYRSNAKALFDQMKKDLSEDGLAEACKAELDALEAAINMDKERILRLKKDEIIPFIEEELSVRYHYQEAGVKIRLRYDTELAEALRN